MNRLYFAAGKSVVLEEPFSGDFLKWAMCVQS